MQLMREESFGPVIGIMKVKSDEEAVKLMNDTEYGLTAYIARIWRERKKFFQNLIQELLIGIAVIV